MVFSRNQFAEALREARSDSDSDSDSDTESTSDTSTYREPADDPGRTGDPETDPDSEPESEPESETSDDRSERISDALDGIRGVGGGTSPSTPDSGSDSEPDTESADDRSERISDALDGIRGIGGGTSPSTPDSGSDSEADVASPGPGVNLPDDPEAYDVSEDERDALDEVGLDPDRVDREELADARRDAADELDQRISGEEIGPGDIRFVSGEPAVDDGLPEQSRKFLQRRQSAQLMTTLEAGAQTRVAAGRIAEQDPRIDRDDIADVRVEDDGFVPELTSDAEQRLQIELLAEETDLERDDIADVEVGDDGQLRPELTDEAETRLQIEQIADSTDLESEDIQDVSVVDREFSQRQLEAVAHSDEQLQTEQLVPTLTDEAQQERLTDQIVEETSLGEDDIIGFEETDDDQFQPVLTDEAEERRAARAVIDQETEIDVADADSFGFEDREEGIIFQADGETGIIEDADLFFDDVEGDTLAGVVGAEPTPTEQDRRILETLIESEQERQAFEAVEFQLEDEYGVELGRDDIDLEEDGDEFVATLSDEGERTVAVETAPFADTPVVGQITRVGAGLRQDELSATDPYAEAFEDRTPGTDEVGEFVTDNVPGAQQLADIGDRAQTEMDERTPDEQDLIDLLPGLSATGVAVGTKAGTTVATGTAAAGLTTGAAFGSVALAGTGYASGRVDSEAVRTRQTTEVGIGSGITDQELQPTDTAVDTTELNVEGTTRRQAEIAQPTGVDVTETTVDVPTGNVFQSELEASREVSESPESDTGRPADGSVVPDEYPLAGRDMPADPSRDYVRGESDQVVADASPIQQPRQRQDREEPAETIGDGDIITDLPEPDQPGPSVREQIRRDDLFVPHRRFPTGESAVVRRDAGESTREAQQRLREVQTPTIQTPAEFGAAEVAGVSIPSSDTGFITGAIDRVDDAQSAAVTDTQTTRDSVGVDAETDVASIQDTAQATRVATEIRPDVMMQTGLQTGLEQRIGIDQTTTTTTTTPPTTTTITPPTTTTTTTPPPTTTRVPLPEIEPSDDDRDLFQDPFGAVEERRVRDLPDPSEDFLDLEVDDI